MSGTISELAVIFAVHVGRSDDEDFAAKFLVPFAMHLRLNIVPFSESFGDDHLPNFRFVFKTCKARHRLFSVVARLFKNIYWQLTFIIFHAVIGAVI